MEVTKDIRYIGVDDTAIDLFEGQYPVPNGISYNSYVIMDEKIAVLDTVDQCFTDEWLSKLSKELGDRKPDYLIVHHMEPDHAANIAVFLQHYPDTVVVGNAKTFAMIENYFELSLEGEKLIVKEGDILDLGKHKLCFVMAPMVHWPEVMVSYDMTDKVLFSADGFGKFGIPSAAEPWDDESRRYYIGIVGKYGVQVQALLKKAAKLDIQMICSLHGPVLKDNLAHYIGLYDKWSSYTPEDEDGIVICYTSVYGHTKKAAELLKERLEAKGAKTVVIYDLARVDLSYPLADAFRYGKLVLATTTYNADIFPFMKTFIEELTGHNFQNRTVGLIENGSWAPMAAKIMSELLSGAKNLKLLENNVHIKASVKAENIAEIDAMADELLK